MQPGQTLSQLTSKLLLKLEQHFAHDRPDLILGHGDTTTCFATALSSFYHHIPFFHVEAGLRTRRLYSPFPEEFNRQTLAPMAQHHFAPTPIERDNLLRDGVSDDVITVTGSTAHDAVRAMQNKVHLPQNLNLPKLDPIVVVTLHRRETNAFLERTLQGLEVAATNHPQALFICPLHPNPSVQSSFRRTLKGLDNVFLTEPLEYPEFISLLLHAKLVVTDSGGVQEEAAFLGKPVLLAREETERADGLKSGLVKIIGLEAENISYSIGQELSIPRDQIQTRIENSFGFSASELIANQVVQALL